ncbi:MAG: isoleucine--tRNA ligase [Candidatus Thermoplasmatota archaeon]
MKYSPELEERICKYWEENKIFEKSVEKGEKKFVFLEGPPTANGIPHPGHVLTRVMKDVVLRYKTMCGYSIARRAGWDTHGLPVEIEVEKKLKLRSKHDIEEYGIEKFNDECKKSVFEYEQEWRRMTERVGFWIDMDNPYITMSNDYIESVWWSLNVAWENGLLYKGLKVTPYCPRCGTSLSSHEVAQGYEEVEDPSIYIKFKFDDAYFLAWTTTPWTLISNVALAVHPDYWYILVENKGEKYIIAEDLAEKVLDGEYKILKRYQGSELEGKSYEPLFNFFKLGKKGYTVITADFVTLDEGTGIVHTAPAFGEEDFEIGKKYELPFLQPVELDGRFNKDVGPLAGVFVKDADDWIINNLEGSGKIYKKGKVRHIYPFCWRCDSPLLYYARECWFIKMSSLIDKLVENNDKVSWYPEHLKNGRFGEFISGAKDWALSRERYWGTPLPIWECNCGNKKFIGSIEELKKRAKNKIEEIELHRPYIDKVILSCEKCNSEMFRVKDVVDCWYDSGCAFFAQWHYPFENKENFEKNFPVDFICEAIDQTRGWFYTLLAVSTLVFKSLCYRSVVSLGHILDKDGQKMSKSKGNVIDPWKIFNSEGADALRWYFLSVNPPWVPTRFYEEGVREALKTILALWNVYSLYMTYSTLDKFSYAKDYVPIERREKFDLWLNSKMNLVIEKVKKHMEEFSLQKAAREIESFIINELSNWYVRRNKKRFWYIGNGNKNSGYSALLDCLLTLSKLIAPFTPYIAEEIYINLRKTCGLFIEESVHLCHYPEITGETSKELIDAMSAIRELAEGIREIRGIEKIKLRQPLSCAYLFCPEKKERLSIFLDILKDEGNVENIYFIDKVEEQLGIKKEIGGTVLFLNTSIDERLRAEGFARDIIRRIQQMRKDMNLELEELVITTIICDDECKGYIEKKKAYIESETRSEKIIYDKKEGYIKNWDIDGKNVVIGITQTQHRS